MSEQNCTPPLRDESIKDRHPVIFIIAMIFAVVPLILIIDFFVFTMQTKVLLDYVRENLRKGDEPDGFDFYLNLMEARATVDPFGLMLIMGVISMPLLLIALIALGILKV